jgi:D-cysteine desulfhydrase family pyridoxal phosphate-dependent enzyme
MISPGKIKLAIIPTPVQTIKFEGKNFLIKRDDLTGTELSGNKVRKLEYLIYQAKKEKAEIIFTDGGEQSNHARATVIAAGTAGIKTKIFLWGSDKKVADGNLFLDKFYGAEISFLNKKEYSKVNDIMYEKRAELSKNGRNVYVIPEGGSTTLGIWGYVSFMSELKNQIKLNKLEGITVAAGSGGTAAGLLAGAALLKLKLKVFAVNVLYPEAEIRKKILQLAEGCILDYRLPCKINESNLKIFNGYSNEGYKKISEDKLSLIKRLAGSTGILLDPAYTGKAFKAYYDNFLIKNKGMKVLFLHTGGLFGVFGRREEYLRAAATD